MKLAIIVAALVALVSKKITDSPGAMLVIPVNGNDAVKEFELSSTFQPVISRGALPLLVTSNQSAPTLVVLLDQEATSVILTETIGTVSTKTSVTFNT